MFSHDHYEAIKETEARSGNKHYKFGTVLVNGYPKMFTSIVRDPNQYSGRYGDAKVVASGDIRKMRYTEPS